MPRPIVAIVGRPNVGKSALFNRLASKRIAIVEDVPGVTRDRIFADASLLGREILLVDTGGFDLTSDDPFAQRIAAQVRIALDEADVIVCLFDGTVEPVAADREAVELLRKSSVPVVYVANKIDNAKLALGAKAFYALGIDALFEVSALHGHGLGPLEQAVSERLPRETDDDELPAAAPRIAIVGRPNAGKSSLVNRLLGKERHLVDERPGTTVDSVDSLFERGGARFILTDTAGIRRKRSIERGVEALAVMHAIRAIERSDTVVLVIDAKTGAAEQDTKIAGLALDHGRALVVALNKTDLLDGANRRKAERHAREVLAFAPWAPFCTISARTGKGLGPLLRTVGKATESREQRITTGALNRFFEEVLERHPPPSQSGHPVRLYYATQVTVRPPTFVVSANHPDRVHFSYQRYVQNQLRERFGFEGTPIRVRYKKHRK